MCTTWDKLIWMLFDQKVSEVPKTQVTYCTPKQWLFVILNQEEGVKKYSIAIIVCSKEHFYTGQLFTGTNSLIQLAEMTLIDLTITI